MTLTKQICIFIMAAALTATLGCVAQNEDAESLNKYIPQGGNLPQGYKLIVILDESTQGLNMTKEIKDFYGPQDIGPANATIGRYDQESLGFFGDAVVTVIALQDEEHARAAISNYLFNFKEAGNPIVDPLSNASLINPSTINNHEVTEIGDWDTTGDGRTFRIRYLYLWNSKNLAVLVEGNTIREKSMELARATGL